MLETTTNKVNTCPNACPIVIDSAKRGPIHVLAACKCWNCPHCAKHTLIPRWTKHLAKLVHKNNHGLYRHIVSKSDWRAFHRSLHRAKANWFAFRLADRMVVYSNTKIGESDWLDRLDCQKYVTADLLALPRRKNAITTSRPWALSLSVRPTGKLVAIGISAGQFERTAHEMGVETERTTIQGNPAVQTHADQQKSAEFIAKLRQKWLVRALPSKTSGNTGTGINATATLPNHPKLTAT